jgi:hypothetical protein
MFLPIAAAFTEFVQKMESSKEQDWYEICESEPDIGNWLSVCLFALPVS